MIILDTCALIWLVNDLDSLTNKAIKTIKENPSQLYVSSISALEIVWLTKSKRISLPCKPDEWFTKALNLHGLKEMVIDNRISLRSGLLPDIHKDPCDRLIIASAQEHKMKIITFDKTIPKYPGIKVIW